MDKKLQLLETHRLRGDDGQTYVVHGYEHLTRLDNVPDFSDQWQATGVFEYKLAGGGHIAVDHHGAMTIPATGVKLEREKALQPS